MKNKIDYLQGRVELLALNEMELNSIFEIMEEYAKSKCEEQREICANRCRTTTQGYKFIEDIIKEAPLPNFSE